jgi:3-oxoacyl-[acyl-carrier protein] reductase
MDLGLKNKRVLITGASRGIGASIAKSFLQEGANIIIVSRGSKQLYELEHSLSSTYPKSEICALKCDCTKKDSLKKLKDRVEDLVGYVDIVVANVGDGRSVTDVIPGSVQWEKTWNNNFNSALYTARTFLPMLQEKRGTLLFISSIAAVESIGAPVDYSTAKTAIMALAKNMSRKLTNIVRVNVIAPGNIIFDGSSWHEKSKISPKKVSQIIESTVPMKRFGLPEEIANSAVFLCSNRASFITGTTLIIDGGQTTKIL